MRSIKLTFALMAVVLSSIVPNSALASTHQVSSFSELQTAINSAVDGDLIEFSSNIIASSRLATNKDLTIDGKGFLWSVTTPGLNEAGIPNAAASNHGLITFQNGSSSVLRNVAMWGGSNTSTGQGAVRVDSGASLRIVNASIERSYTQTASRLGGGGLINYGTAVLDGVKVRRNGAGYGGGFLNYSNLIIMNSTFSDNRSTSTSGGGGAGENGSGGKLWILNSTFANNLSTEIGSAINNYQGTFYIAHSTFVGNLGTSSNYPCGAVGVNGGSGKVVSSLFAYNYEVIAGAYALVDLGNTSTSWGNCKTANIEVDYSMIHSANSPNATAGWLSSKGSGNFTYSASIDGQSNETLFSGGVTLRPTGGNGEQISSPVTSIFRPNLLLEGDMPIAKLKDGNATPGISGAAPLYFEENGSSTILAFWDSATNNWSVLSGNLPGTVTTASDSNHSLDQVGTPHLSPAAMGATELTTQRTYSVVAVKQTGGNVAGATVYGDAFPANTRVEVAAIPDAGYAFSKWEIQLEEGSTLANLMAHPWQVGLRLMSTTIESTSNPITFAVTTNTTIKPIFVQATAGTHSIIYSANGATSGTAPSASVQNAGSTYNVLGNSGSLGRIGFSFAGWNTAANGAGTSYSSGDSLSVGSNVTLFAQWTPVPTMTVSYSGNGSDSGSVPSSSTVNVGSSLTVSSNSGGLARSGFRFVGWNTLASGLGVTYAPGASLSGSASLVLYAMWETNAPAQTPNSPGVNSPTAYVGPIINGVIPSVIYAGEKFRLSISGERLASVTSISIDGVQGDELRISDEQVSAVFSQLQAGDHSIEMVYGGGARLTYLNSVKVLPARNLIPESASKPPKVNAGTFNGLIAIYARGFEGKRLSWNINGKWGVVDRIPAGTLFRALTPAAHGNYRISIYVDRKFLRDLILQVE